jgi:hypothetical protein
VFAVLKARNARFFFALGKNVVFAGVLKKYVRLVWCFGGEIVVNCVAKVVLLHHIFARRKKCQLLQIYFRFLLRDGGCGRATLMVCDVIC